MCDTQLMRNGKTFIECTTFYSFMAQCRFTDSRLPVKVNRKLKLERVKQLYSLYAFSLRFTPIFLQESISESFPVFLVTVTISLNPLSSYHISE